MLLAYCGIAAASSFALLYIAGILGTGLLAMLTVCSFLIGVIHLEGRIKYSLLAYAAVALLALMLLPDKRGAAAYAGLFGYYPILKHAIESLRRLSLEWAFKLLFFSGICLGFWALFFRNSLPWFSVLPGAGILCVYDYALTRMFHYYQKRLRGHLIRRR